MGKFKNPGVCWEQQPQPVLDHDFPSDAVGRAIPYGIYDAGKNRGFVVVGTSHETPAFAVDALAGGTVADRKCIREPRNC